MQSYVQLKENGIKEYKPIICMVVRTSTLPQTFEKVLPNSKVRSINEVWQIDRDIYTGKVIKTLLWQRAKIVEIVTELGNKLNGDPDGEKYFIREDPIKEALSSVTQNNLSSSFIKEDKNAIHVPVDAEEFVNVVQNERNEDIIR